MTTEELVKAFLVWFVLIIIAMNICTWWMWIIVVMYFFSMIAYAGEHSS